MEQGEDESKFESSEHFSSWRLLVWTLAGASFEAKRKSNGIWNCKRALSGVAVEVVIPTRIVDASVPIVSLSGQAKAAMAVVTTVANPTAATVTADFLVTSTVVAFVVGVLRDGDVARFLAHRWIPIHGYGGNCNTISFR
jgi:hypothetical protein